MSINIHTLKLNVLFIVSIVTALGAHGGLNLTNNLIAWYPFDGNALDASGNARHGTPHNVTPATDRFSVTNGCYLFNGVNGSVSIPITSLSTGTTIAAWIKLANVPVGSGHIYQGLNGSADVFIRLESDSRFHTRLSGGCDVQSDGTLLTETWYHVAVVFNAGQGITEYINGVLVGSTQMTFTARSGLTSNIGRHAFDVEFFSGWIDDVCIYGRALSVQEIVQLYEGSDDSITITTTPATVSYHTTSAIVAGTNGSGIIGDMWVSNAANGEVHSFLAELGWTAPSVSLAEGTNQIRVYGTNTFGSTYFDSVILSRGREQDLPILDPLTNITVREHQVFFGQAHGRSNIVTVTCNAGTNQGVVCFDTNQWGFSGIPALGTAGHTWNIAFIGANAYGSETQVLAVTVAPPAKGIGVKKPLLFEDVDGDLLSIKYSGIKKEGSVALFDGQNLVVTNAIPDGKLVFAVKQNKKTGGDGSFTLRDVHMDNSGTSATIGGNVDKVSMAGWRLESLKFSAKEGVVSNITLESVKTISAKGTIVGIVAVSNGFETMSVGTTMGATVLVGVPVGANPTTTYARATFKSLKVPMMINTIITGRDTLKSGSIIEPKITFGTVVDSFFYHTKVNDTVAIEPL